jgi:AraC-like DNA-binding protein
MHVSTFYFCKIFKKATGLTFTEYLGRVRIEKAKTLLLNPHLRISEIAYDVGFQSLTHFNRIFRKTTGEAPTTFRDRGTSQPKAMVRTAVSGAQLRSSDQLESCTWQLDRIGLAVRFTQTNPGLTAIAGRSDPPGLCLGQGLLES